MTDLELTRKGGALVPLSRAEVAHVEAQAHALGLPSLVALAEGLDDEDIPFPFESGLDEYLDQRLDAAMLEGTYDTEEDPSWD